MDNSISERSEHSDKAVFDLSKALEVVDGDSELFKELVKLFLKNVPDNLAQIRHGLAKSDANVVERAAHSLKGSVSNFAATRAFEAAYRLEVLGREGRLGEGETALSKLDEELNLLKSAMNEVLAGDEE